MLAVRGNKIEPPGSNKVEQGISTVARAVIGVLEGVV